MSDARVVFDCNVFFQALISPHYVNLALAAGAKYVASRDNDLLDLMDQTQAEGREFRARFPELEIIEPQFLLQLLQS